MSYMRGHVPDMDAVMEVVEKHDLFFIEDCAHRVLHDVGRTSPRYLRSHRLLFHNRAKA